MENAFYIVKEEIGKRKKPLIIAIDGRCASGKTTLAKQLSETLNCNVIHTDSFFPRPEQRTPERLNEPGGNLDRERLLSEVMEPLKRGEAFSYRVFDCKTQSLGEEIRVEPRPVTIIEGSYCCHPALWEYYGLRVFLNVDPTEQLRRIERRNGADKLAVFREKWIPLEEKYFAAFDIEKRCDFIFNTGELLWRS